MLSTKLRQLKGGTTVKQGDSRSSFKYELLDYLNNPLDELNGQQATVRLHRFREIFYEKQVEVTNASVEFTIDKVLKSDNYSVEIICGNYVLPSNQHTTIYINSASDEYVESNLVIQPISNNGATTVINYDDTALKRKIAVLESELQQISTKQDNDTVYNDEAIVRRITALESKTDRDTVYNDSGLRTRIANLENALKIMTAELEKIKDTSIPITPIIHTVDVRPAKSPLAIEDLEFTNNTDPKLFTIDSDNIFKKTAIQDYKTRILFKEDIKEFDVTTIRNGQWFVIGYNTEETIVFGAFGHDNTTTGKISLINNTTHRITELINPNQLLAYFPRGYDRIRLGDKLKFKINEDGTELLIQKMYNDVYEDFFKLTPNSHVALTEKRFNRLGICVGVSGTENSGSIMNNIMKDVTVYRKPKEDKYAIFVVAGQSNAVGYDESTIEHEDYTEHPRIFQLGQYGENKNKVIPLGKFAETYQNMSSFTADGKGTKGIHLPLAKKLLSDVSEDYKILVISASYGDTGFRTGGLGTYNSIEDIPNTSLMWSTESAYYKSMVERTKYALNLNVENKFIGVVWIQGEHDGSANAAANHNAKFTEMADHFVANMQEFASRTKKGIIDKDMWFNVQSTHYWNTRGQYPQILENYKNWNLRSFVEISTTNDHTNAVNGTGRTSSNRASHFGNNAYATLVAPAVYDKMKELEII